MVKMEMAKHLLIKIIKFILCTINKFFNKTLQYISMQKTKTFLGRIVLKTMKNQFRKSEICIIFPKIAAMEKDMRAKRNRYYAQTIA